MNSLHQQAIDRPGEGVVVEGVADDGTIEAIRVRDVPGFAMGVQWHPEFFIDPGDRKIFEALIAACARTGTFLEINANPKRLDLRPEHARAAINAGVKLCISSDAHNTGGLDVLRYGVDTARRGWASKADIVNTRTWPQIQKRRKRG